MIEVTNTATQTISPGGIITFDKLLLKSGCGECYNAMLPTSVKLCSNGKEHIYELSFSGNVTNTAANNAVQLAIALGGVQLPQTARTVTPTVAGALWVLPTSTIIRICCCDMDRVSVMNTGANPIVIAPNATLRVVRKS